MLDSLFKVLGPALSLWDRKDKRKYIDSYLEQKRRYREEQNKNPADRSDAVLDDIHFELRLIVDALSADVGEPNAPNQPGTTGV